jgi:uncharacterized repeat protein (TIGR04138 family)
MRENAITLSDLVRAVGRYDELAFLFVREGLSYTVEQIHGPESKAQRWLSEYVHKHEMDWSQLASKYHTGELPPAVVRAVEAAGGLDRLNRHVSGRQLCWGLRDYALDRWGILARVVLESWGVRGTLDFGRIVFAFIDHDIMQRQDGDALEDFQEVYAFPVALDQPVCIRPEEGNGEADEPSITDD